MAFDAATISAHLYEGVIDPAQWYAGLEAIRQANEGALFYNFAVDATSFEVVQSMQNEQFPADQIREYELHHARHDERMPVVMGMGVGEVMYDHEHFSERELSKSFIYSDWLPSMGYKHTMCMPLFDDGLTREFLSIIRPADHGAYGSDNRELITRLMPDLVRATKLRARMSSLASQASAGLAAVDALSQCVVVLDSSCNIRFMNAAAHRDIAGPTGFIVRHRKLQAAAPATQSSLNNSVRLACGVGGVTVRGSVVRLTESGVPRLCSVLPLQPTHVLAATLQGGPQALLVWSRPRSIDDAGQLSLVLGITETEARLALLLVTGQTLKDFAALQGCTWHTARAHLKNVMQKTGCNRQVDLVQLLLSLQLA